MTLTKQSSAQVLESRDKLVKRLDDMINNAIKKVGGTKENDICKYLPVSTGGYMHHFTLRKMKTENPSELSEMIDRFIIRVEKPGKVPPKPRAARGSRKKRDQIHLTKNDIDRMLNIARLAGDKEMIAKLTPKKSLAALKRELISAIRQNKADQELWNQYVESLHAQGLVDAQAAGATGFGAQSLNLGAVLNGPAAVTTTSL